MKISTKADVKDATRRLNKLARKQIPYATSRALNETIDRVRDEEMTEIVRKVDRPTPETVEAYRTIKNNKRQLYTVITLKSYAGYLAGLIHGGHESTPKPVPGRQAKLTPHGNLPRQATKGAKVFWKETRGGHGAYWKTVGRGKNKRLQMVGVVPKGGRSYSKRIDFYGVAERTARKNFAKLMRKHLRNALRTAR